MSLLMSLLAQDPPTGGAKPGATPGGGGAALMIGLMIFLVVFFLISSRSQKKERAQKQALLDNIKKNDRVMTIGGIIGTVVGVKDNEVVVKVDESTNTRMTFMKRSIQQVLTGTEIPEQSN